MKTREFDAYFESFAADQPSLNGTHRWLVRVYEYAKSGPVKVLEGVASSHGEARLVAQEAGLGAIAPYRRVP